jgi:hypothetical protein
MAFDACSYQFLLRTRSRSRFRLHHPKSGSGPDEADIDEFGDSRVRPEDDEDNIMNFKFSKFAGTYFQGSANAFYIRRAIKAPLLNIKGAADKQAVGACFLMQSFWSITSKLPPTTKSSLRWQVCPLPL